MESGIPVFFKPWWLDIACGKGKWDCLIERNQDNTIASLFVIPKERLVGFPLIRTPYWTPYTGPYVVKEPDFKRHNKIREKRKIMSNFLDRIPNVSLIDLSLHPSVTDWYPFYLRGFTQTTRYTYIINHDESEETLWDGLDPNLRRDIQYAENNYQIDNDLKGDELLSMMDDGLFNMKAKNRSRLIKIISEANERNSGHLMGAKNEHGNWIAGVFLLEDGHSFYNMINARAVEVKNRGALALLIWRGILLSRRNNKAFDMEGSMIEGVERFFGKFGGKLVAKHRVIKTNWMWQIYYEWKNKWK